jgi:hypothetical protein
MPTKTYAFTGGTSAMLVVHAGDRISDRSFHSRLNPCECRHRGSLAEPAVDFVERPHQPVALADVVNEQRPPAHVSGR